MYRVEKRLVNRVLWQEYSTLSLSLSHTLTHTHTHTLSLSLSPAAMMITNLRRRERPKKLLSLFLSLSTRCGLGVKVDVLRNWDTHTREGVRGGGEKEWGEEEKDRECCALLLFYGLRTN